MFIKFVMLVDCFLCNCYPWLLFESLSHVINQESDVYSWNLEKIYLVHFLKFFLKFFKISKKWTLNLSQISLLKMRLIVQIFSLKTVKDLMNHFLLERNLFYLFLKYFFTFCISVLCNLSTVKSSKVYFCVCIVLYIYLNFFQV